MMPQATESHAVALTPSISIPDFTIYATTPGTVPAYGTTPATSIIIVLPIDGFIGNVTLSDLALPTHLKCTAIDPATISKGSGKATLSCSSAFEGVYEVTVIGSSGGLSHDSMTTFTFEAYVPPDFRISSVSPVSLASGASVNLTITVTSLGGFDSQVNLTATVYPSTGLSVSMNPQSLDGGGLSKATFNASQLGDYSVNITAVSLSLSHTTRIVVDVTLGGGPDFEISAGSSIINIKAGNSGSTAITITSKNGFANSVALVVTAPAGVSCYLSPTSIQSSGESTLTCSCNIAGDYAVLIRASNEDNTQATTVNVHVTAPSPVAPTPSTSPKLSTWMFYIIAVLTFAIIASATTILLLRKSKHSAVPNSQP